MVIAALDNVLHQSSTAQFVQPEEWPEESIVDCWQMVGEACWGDIIQHIAAVR